MLRKVAPDDVRLGMFVHGFEGSWLDHPFWRRRFLLADDADVERVRRSRVAAVLIDTTRGIDAEPGPSARMPAAEPAWFAPKHRPAAPRTPYRPAPLHPPKRRYSAPAPRAQAPAPDACSAAQEYDRAARIIGKSRRAIIRAFQDVRLGKAVRSEALLPVVDEITASITRNKAAIVSIARLKSQHEYTYMHSVAVGTLMINLARYMGLSDREVREAGLAGLLHDIGKMAVPDDLLDKPARLTDAEFAIVRGHPRAGHAILQTASGVPDMALDVCLHHHEKIDGSGYPQGLPAESISLYARMGAICDVYDAITSERAYKAAWDPGDALRQMMQWEGHFDPEILRAFTHSIGIYPIGGLVRLASDRLAVVTGENDADPMHPPMRAFRCIATGKSIAPAYVAPGSDEILAMTKPEDHGLHDWKKLQAKLLAIAAADQD